MQNMKSLNLFNVLMLKIYVSIKYILHPIFKLKMHDKKYTNILENK